MILKSLKIENIRSYTSQMINFPAGSILLSGDIGSGKSSVLLAIEFALFGISKGTLSGSNLLRQGSNEGSVELRFSLNNEDYTIKRNLKKSRDIIAQSSGYILKGDEKKEGTAQELKTEILSLLGYPQEALTRKSMIYRYTVYTPQEEMKQILQEDKEMRIDTLRKVFGIDKYKRIIENSAIIVRGIKEGKKLLQGKLSDFEEKSLLLDKAEREKAEASRRLMEIIPLVKSAKEKLNEKKVMMALKEKKIEELNEYRRKMEAINARVREKAAQNERTGNEMERIRADIEQMKLKMEKSGEGSGEEDALKQQIGKKKDALLALDEEVKQKPKIKEDIQKIEKDVVELARALEEKSTLKRQYEISKSNINSMSECPACKQAVPQSHKQTVIALENSKIKRVEEEISRIEEMKRKMQQELDNGRIKIDLIEQKERELNLLTQEIMGMQNRVEIRQKERENVSNIINEKTSLFDSKIKLKEELREEVSAISQLREAIREKLELFKDEENEYKALKGEFDVLLKKERDIEIKEAELRKELESKEYRIKELDEEIGKKLKAKEKLQKIGDLQSWIEDYFTKLMSTMERKVMAKVYLQFNELFQQWFNTLLEDDAITARLDDEFTPIIVQNGYETGMENLSGGEKTSLALAYRLSLNKVINDVISTIKTKNLIILDEPTDGFSTEQLDKVRDVLEQLDTRQTIIVSHESKIESYVDNVIRISKGEHVSRVIS